MEWTEADKAMCAKIAAEVVEKVLLGHVAACPFGKRQLRDRALLVGACVGSGIGGGGILFAILEQISKGG
jgi:hypothetical protein